VSSSSGLDSGFGSVSRFSSSYSSITIRLFDDDGGIYPVITSISCLSYRHLITKVLPLHFKLNIFFASLAAISYNNNNSVFLLVASVSSSFFSKLNKYLVYLCSN
jgi:hypothetical protein